MPKVMDENVHMKKQLADTEQQLNDMAVAKCYLQDELLQLKNRHDVILQKLVVEEQLKNKAVDDMVGIFMVLCTTIIVADIRKCL